MKERLIGLIIIICLIVLATIITTGCSDWSDLEKYGTINNEDEIIINAENEEYELELELDESEGEIEMKFRNKKTKELEEFEFSSYLEVENDK